MLTEPPEPDHAEIAVRYLPAAEAARVGGDWYDAFLQPGGTTMLVIGDVVGHDTEAAAAMGQLRSLLRGIATYSDAPPVEVLRGLDASMATLRVGTLATAAVARFEQTPEEVGRGVTRMRWANAGHLPPLVINADGSVAELAPWVGDLMLGVDPTAQRHESVVTLDRGATVLLYTDGLVERRDADLDQGLLRLPDGADRAGRAAAGRAARRDHRATGAGPAGRRRRAGRRPAAPPGPAAAGRGGAQHRAADRAAGPRRPLTPQALSRRTVAFRPLIMVALSELMTSFAAGSGTSTSANRWWISIAPMSRPVSPVSPVIAPTRSPGRIPPRGPAPTNSRAVGPPERPAGRPLAAAGRAGPRPASRSVAEPDLRDLLVVVGRPGRLVRELHRGQRHLHEVELVGQGLDHDAEAVQLVAEQALAQRRPGQVQPPGAQVGHRGHASAPRSSRRRPARWS